MEASRARDRFVLVTDNRESLEEALEENDGARLTAREAVGEADPPARAADGAIRMLRDLQDDWHDLLARAEAETTALNLMEGYARIVTGVQAVAAGLDLSPEMQGFVDEVRRQDKVKIGFEFAGTGNIHARHPAPPSRLSYPRRGGHRAVQLRVIVSP